MRKRVRRRLLRKRRARPALKYSNKKMKLRIKGLRKVLPNKDRILIITKTMKISEREKTSKVKMKKKVTPTTTIPHLQAYRERLRHKIS